MLIWWFDMDGVLADLLAPWIPVLNKWSGLSLTAKDVDLYGLEQVYPLTWERVQQPLHWPGFWENLPPYREAVEFAKKIHDMGHDVRIATTPFPSDNCAWEKTLWIEEHLPFVGRKKITMTHDKHLLYGDVIIDDKPENVVGFRGISILWDQPWNRKLENGIQEYWFHRCKTWQEVEQRIRTLRPYSFPSR